MRTASRPMSMALLGVCVSMPLWSEVVRAGADSGDTKRAIRLEDDHYLIEASGFERLRSPGSSTSKPVST